MRNAIESAPPTCGEQVCTACGATGVRIWRPYQSWPDRLLCFTCACADQGVDPGSVTEESSLETCARSNDAIRWLVPACVDGEGNWWGYTSIPQERCDEWLALPLAPTPGKDEPQP